VRPSSTFRIAIAVTAFAWPMPLHSETFSHEPFDIMFGFFDVGEIFPIAPILESDENAILMSVVNDGDNLERFATFFAESQSHWHAQPPTYESERNFALALSVVGQNEEARARSDAAMRLATEGSFSWTEARLLRAILEMRLEDPTALFYENSTAGYYLDEACRWPAEGFSALCLQLEAFLANRGPLGNRGAAMIRLRSSPIPTSYPMEAFPAGVEWDALRAAFYDFLRHIYGAAFDQYGRDNLHANVSAGLYLKLRETMVSEGPTSDPAVEAMNQLVSLELRRGNAAQAIFWLNLFEDQVIRKFEIGFEDLTRLKFLHLRNRAVASLIEGDFIVARQSADLARQLFGPLDSEVQYYARLFYLADNFDLPGRRDLALALFEEIWRWTETQPIGEFNFTARERIELMPIVWEMDEWVQGEPALFDYERSDALRFATGVRMLSIFAERGDITSFERYRLQLSDLAQLLDGEAGVPLHSTVLKIKTADAIRAYSITPQRLAEAEAIIEEVQVDIAGPLSFPNGEPSVVNAFWNLMSRKLDRDPIGSVYNLFMRPNAKLRWRYEEVAGRIYLAQGDVEQAYERLEPAFGSLIREATIGGNPERQAFIALDIARIELLRGTAGEAATWAEEALLGISIARPKSVEAAEILGAYAEARASIDDFYGAELAILRSISIRAEHGVAGQRELAMDWFRLAAIYSSEGDKAGAIEAGLKAADILRTNRLDAFSSGESQHLRALIDLLGEAGSSKPELVRRAFAISQWLKASEAAEALSAARRRIAITDIEVRKLEQTRGELRRQRAVLETQLAAAFGQEESKQNLAYIDQLGAEILRVEKRIAELPSTAKDEPVAVPEEFAIDDAGHSLGQDQALLVLGMGRDHGWAWVITNGAAPLMYSLGDRDKLLEEVLLLRCQLAPSDKACGEMFSEVVQSASEEGDIAVTSSTDMDVSRASAPSDPANLADFDLDHANRLFKRLLGPAWSLLRSRPNLFVVTDDEFAGFPLHVLITEPPQVIGTEYAFREARWLVRSHAITVLPTVASLSAPTIIESSAGSTGFLGIGNPVIGENPNAVDCDTLKRTAWINPPRSIQPKGNELLNTGAFVSGFVVADVNLVRALPALPETSCELTTIARNLNAMPEKLLLQGDATETMIKELSTNDVLDDYRIVAFATHGLVAGNLGLVEPALVMTPPAVADTKDDGLLTASEIASLNFDADWVILSACNTASPSNLSGQNLSGLARAFFYSGARSLLVSAWPVNSRAATQLTTSMFLALQQQPTLSRAAALSHSMRNILDDPSSSAWQLHPSYWAPFSYVSGNAG
jgi:CHAT domain-containing protein